MFIINVLDVSPQQQISTPVAHLVILNPKTGTSPVQRGAGCRDTPKLSSFLVPLSNLLCLCSVSQFGLSLLRSSDF